jgi:hypothetical protein
MTAIELQTKREELIKSIPAIDNEKMPYTYPIEEIRQRAAEFEAIIEGGDMTQFVPHDEVFKKYGI